MSLSGELWIPRLEEFGERMKAHPVRFALFFSAGPADIYHSRVSKSHFGKPGQQGGATGQKPYIVHHRVTAFRHQDFSAPAFDNQRFQHQLTARPQGFFQFTQMIDLLRRAAWYRRER